jgi:hypothetical protein
MIRLKARKIPIEPEARLWRSRGNVLRGIGDSEPLNRGLAVTDKRQGAWQNRATRMQMGSLRSVCRELPRMALAACKGHMYRLRLNRCVQAYD